MKALSSRSTSLFGRQIRKTRKTYTKEFKLQTFTLLQTPSSTKREVARNVGIDPATLLDWEKSLDQILKSRKGSRKQPGSGRRAFWPDMEKELVQEFTTARKKGVSITHG